MATQSTEYGRRQGHGHCILDCPIGASEVFKKQGGSFLKDDSSGRLEIAGAAHTNILGHALFNEDFTASSTEGGTILPVDFSNDSIWELPIDSASAVWADTMRFKTCDLKVTSNVQGVNLSASSADVVTLVAKGTTNPAGTVVSVLVMRYLKNQALTGVV